jgi:hypothetical protein
MLRELAAVLAINEGVLELEILCFHRQRSARVSTSTQ